MKKSSTVQNNFEVLAKNYEKSLEELVHQAKTKTHLSIDAMWQDIQSFRDIGFDEAGQLKHALRRDLADAKQYLADTNKELKFWLGFEYGMLKSELWQTFKEATDVTSIELLRSNDLGALNTYEVGEVIGLGTLECDQCNKLHYFTYPSTIQTCNQCNGMHFHRVFNETY
jgi:hypothetical protein